jgi:hypothetical protein
MLINIKYLSNFIALVLFGIFIAEYNIENVQ